MSIPTEPSGRSGYDNEALAVPPRSSLTSRVLWPLVFVLVGIGAWGVLNYAGGAASAAEAEKGGLADWEASLEKAFEKAKAEDKPILVYFTADWCPPCQMFKKEVLTKAEVDGLIKEQVVPVLVDVDTLQDKEREAEMKLAAKLKVEFIPDMYMFDSEGNRVGRYSFNPSESDLPGKFSKWLKEGVAKAKAGE
ncbi:MAG: thioredoxin family protein [Planctomycetota bacterium]